MHFNLAWLSFKARFWRARLRIDHGGLALAVGLVMTWAVAPVSMAGTLPTSTLAPTPTVPLADTLAQRLAACTHCHGAQGRAGPDGYYPRLAGKPEGYLFNQLKNFRDGRRHYGPMVALVDPLSDTYLREIAHHFATQEAPYPPPVARPSAPTLLARGQQLVLQGDASRRIPACVQCHGQALTGVAPSIPGLLGLPRDYLNGQLGAWVNGQRHAQAPDCMADIAKRLQGDDVSAVTAWLSSQPWPTGAHPADSLRQPLPMPCGGVSMANSSAAPKPGLNGSLPLAPEAAKLANTVSPLSQGGTLGAAAQRGAILARAGNCMGCHTVRGGSPYAGGRALSTPFGAIYSSNLTPDPQTGLGRWSPDDFWRALHHGTSRDGRWLYPAFPYPNYTLVTRADSDALFAYLRTVLPVRQARPEHELSWPFSTQAALGVWRALFFKEATFAPEPSQSPEWNRGAYLVRGLGHCAACHEGRNVLGATTGAELSGGLMPVQNWYAPSLRDPLEAGMATWPVADIVALLQAGRAPQGRVRGPMAEVVLHGTQHLPQADLQAMAVFLKSLPQVVSRPEPAPAATPEAMLKGAALYKHHCATCHGDQGQGRSIGDQAVYPALAANRMVRLPQAVNLVRAIAQGGFGPATPGHPRPFGMPPFAQQLKDDEIAALASFLRQSWGAQASAVEPQDVSRFRAGADE
jgi:cytochrome c553